LENTSNEGFLANKFARSASREELLANPADRVPKERAPTAMAQDLRGTGAFHNEPTSDFTLAAEREKISSALRDLRGRLGAKHRLVIGNKAVSTAEWQPSLNPVNQTEVIGYAAQADISHAEAALAAARAAQPKWARTSADDRATLLEKVSELMHDQK